MLETAIALALGHLLADFVLQSDAMVRSKAQPVWLLGHVAVVAAASWAALGLAAAPGLLMLVAGSHFAIDWLKIRHGGQGFAPFAIDQAGHAAAIALGAALWPETWGAGFWGFAATPAWLPEAMAVAAGAIAAVPAGGYAVRSLMHGLALPADPAGDASLPQGGRLIGRLERAMILMLVLAGQPDGIGFLIAAKSLLRFSELARDQDRRASEYVIIGTLASFAWGLGAAYAAETALGALGP